MIWVFGSCQTPGNLEPELKTISKYGSVFCRHWSPVTGLEKKEEPAWMVFLLRIIIWVSSSSCEENDGVVRN